MRSEDIALGLIVDFKCLVHMCGPLEGCSSCERWRKAKEDIFKALEKARLEAVESLRAASKSEQMVEAIVCKDGNIHGSADKGWLVKPMEHPTFGELEPYCDGDAQEVDGTYPCGPHSLCVYEISKWTEEEVKKIKAEAKRLMEEFGKDSSE